MTQHADLKLPLIDLETSNMVTGGKQDFSVQPERLNKEGNMCVYWIHLLKHNNIYEEGYVGITSDYNNRLSSHLTNKRKTHFKFAINKYGWENLNKQIIYNNISLEDALEIERIYRPKQNIGWNSQKGGEIGVEKEWYLIPENRKMHQENTSKATKIAIALKDTKEKRSNRAKENWIKNKESYKNSFKGSNNPRAILNEEQVKHIKCELLSKFSDTEIGNIYGVKFYVIGFIRSGKNWKHITCDSPAHKQVD